MRRQRIEAAARAGQAMARRAVDESCRDATRPGLDTRRRRNVGAAAKDSTMTRDHSHNDVVDRDVNKLDNEANEACMDHDHITSRRTCGVV